MSIFILPCNDREKLCEDQGRILKQELFHIRVV